MKLNIIALTKRAAAMAAALSLLVTSSSTHAGFLQDFYNSAGASVNVTPAQVAHTQSLDMISGGSVVFRSPQKNFTPFYFTPPSLKVGCGGIDLFMGSFGMANMQQFVEFLRSIGQNAVGLAFKVALTALSPELASQIQDIANTINSWNQSLGSSCQLANQFMAAGPNQWITNIVTQAKQNLLGTGENSGYFNSSQSVPSNPAANTIASGGTPPANSGITVETTPTNLTWDALSSTSITDENGNELSDDQKQLYMSLIGTVIFKPVNGSSDPSATPEDKETKMQGIPYLGKLSLDQFIGDINPGQQEGMVPTITLPVWQCQSDPDNKCLEMAEKNLQETAFAPLVYDKALKLKNAIINRQPPDVNAMKLLTVTTSIPIYKLIVATTMRDTPFFGDDILIDYSKAVALEIATRYIESTVDEVQKALTSRRDSSSLSQKKEYLITLGKKIDTIRQDMKASRQNLYAEITKQGAMIQQIEQINKALYANLSLELTSNLNFGR